MTAHRKFDTQFKLEVVHMLEDHDLSVSEVSKTMEVFPSRTPNDMV